eukprot:scaffold9114_cov118-Isochrysis_galbana.AAC.12
MGFRLSRLGDLLCGHRRGRCGHLSTRARHPDARMLVRMRRLARHVDVALQEETVDLKEKVGCGGVRLNCGGGDGAVAPPFEALGGEKDVQNREEAEDGTSKDEDDVRPREGERAARHLDAQRAGPKPVQRQWVACQWGSGGGHL